MLPRLGKIRRMALDLVFPRRCVGCGAGGEYICRKCRTTLARLMPPLCPRCGRPQPSGILCPDCVSWRAEIDGIRSPFLFEGIIQQAVYQLKYRNLRALVPDLAGLMAEYLRNNEIPGDVLIPVPLHKKRLRDRGYNQSELLARDLGQQTGIPVISGALQRQRETASQVRTSTVQERQQNVSGAFACRPGNLEEARVILIDDVSTSGATLDACAVALKEGGAATVWGLALAREI